MNERQFEENVIFSSDSISLNESTSKFEPLLMLSCKLTLKRISMVKHLKSTETKTKRNRQMFLSCAPKEEKGNEKLSDLP